MSKIGLIILWMGMASSLVLSIIAVVKASSSKRCLLHTLVDDLDEGQRVISVDEQAICVTVKHPIDKGKIPVKVTRHGTDKIEKKTLG